MAVHVSRCGIEIPESAGHRAGACIISTTKPQNAGRYQLTSCWSLLDHIERGGGGGGRLPVVGRRCHEGNLLLEFKRKARVLQRCLRASSLSISLSRHHAHNVGVILLFAINRLAADSAQNSCPFLRRNRELFRDWGNERFPFIRSFKARHSRQAVTLLSTRDRYETLNPRFQSHLLLNLWIRHIHIANTVVGTYISQALESGRHVLRLVSTLSFRL